MLLGALVPLLSYLEQSMSVLTLGVIAPALMATIEAEDNNPPIPALIFNGGLCL